jgi:hypothetical protein
MNGGEVDLRFVIDLVRESDLTGTVIGGINGTALDLGPGRIAVRGADPFVHRDETDPDLGIDETAAGRAVETGTGHAHAQHAAIETAEPGPARETGETGIETETEIRIGALPDPGIRVVNRPGEVGAVLRHAATDLAAGTVTGLAIVCEGADLLLVRQWPRRRVLAGTSVKHGSKRR